MATSYMLPIAKIKEGVNKGIQEDRGRATHGDTSLNAFFIDELGKVYTWRDRGDLPLGHGAYFDDSGHHPRFNPGAVMVHSHAAENWAHFEQMTGGIEPMTSFSVSDILFLQGMVRKNTGNTLALIHADGRLELLRVPELGTDWILGLDAAKITLQASPPENWLPLRKHRYDTWADVQKRVVKDFAKRNKLVYKDGLRWKPEGKVVEPLVKKRSYYPRPKYPWYEMIWEETGTPSPGITATTKPYWMVIPGEAWPAEPQEMELFRARPGGRARQTYTRVPWFEAQEEAQQMRFFGQSLGAAPAFRLTREAWQPSFELPRPGKPKPTPGVRVKPKIRKADLSADEKKAIDAIGEGSVHIDDIGRKSGLAAHKVSAALVMLELKGLIQQTAGKRFHTKKQPSAFGFSGNGLAGRIAHCGIWDRDRYTGDLICREYFTACQATDRCLTIPELPKSQTRVCVKFKDVPSITTPKGYVSRCAHYDAVCRPVGCIRSAAPHPELRGELDPKQIRAVAEWMAEEHEERKGVDPKWLAREIASRGGLRAYRKQYPGQKTDPEYMAIPLFMKKKSGLPPDEMADEMGYRSDTELYRDIHRAYPPKTPKTALQKRIERQKKTWRDFEEGAVNYLLEQSGAGIYV